MDSHDGKRRSHQRFLKNLPKQKKYLKVILSSVVEVILSSVADPDNLGGGGGGGLTVLSLALPAFPLSAILFFFLPKIRKG